MMGIIRTVVLGVLGFTGLALLGLAIAARVIRPPTNLGVSNGQLAPCPTTPNCVTSQGDNPEQAIAPLSFTGSAVEAQERLRSIVTAMERSQIVTEEPGYLQVVFRSRVFGFPDDVEFLIVPDRQIVQVRAAARLGWSDLGVNRARVEAIREAFQEE